MIELSRLEAVLDEAELAAKIVALEAALPIGVRRRQLPVRSLLLGMLACLSDDHQNAHLSAVHASLLGLVEAEQWRLGVIAKWKAGPHLLTYRQVEYTAHLVFAALRKDLPDGAPSDALQTLCDLLCEASIPLACKDASGSYAIDWTDVPSFFRPPGEKDGPCVDPEAAWGHRRGDGPGQRDELFFGYYASLMTMVKDESGELVPELIRRCQLSSCRHDPVPCFVLVVTNSAAAGVAVHDALSDCGYSHKVPEHFAFPLRAVGARLVIDLHPAERGQKGTFAGAICANGNLYCPATPKALFELGPLALGASETETAAHDERAAELFRYKLGRLSVDDRDGYHRVSCPAELGKLRCPLRPASISLSYDRPEIFEPPLQPPTCCVQKSVTIPPQVNPKTRQKHDYPGPAWRRSYGRRSGVERSNARLKDPSGINLDVRGWCKLAGIVPNDLFFACACVIVNFSLIDAFEQRQAATLRPDALRPSRPRRHRRLRLAELAGSANAPP